MNNFTSDFEPPSDSALTSVSGSTASYKQDAPPHNCYENAKVLECDEVTDKCECRKCGRIFTVACNFDEDYS